MVNSSYVTCQAPRSVGAYSLVSFAVYEGAAAVSDADIPSNFQYHPSLFISDYANDRVLRFHASTGEFVDEFVPRGRGGLSKPYGISYGPNQHFYVASAGTKSVIQYDGNSGAFLKKFCTVSGEPRALVFHYNDLFVASHFSSAVFRFASTGSPRGVYISDVQYPWGITFDKLTNDSYVTSAENDHVYRYLEPNQGLWGELGLANSSDERLQHRSFARFDKVFTNIDVPYALKDCIF